MIIHRMGSREYFKGEKWILLAIIVAAFIFCAVSLALGTSVCLTKKEARHLWPRQHIYWYSSDHCWSNRRGGPPRGIKVDPVLNKVMAEEKPKPKGDKVVIKIVRADEFNELDAQVNEDPIPFWQYHAEIDLSKYHTWYDRDGNARFK